MRSARLDMALESGAFTLPPAGDVAVYRPRIGDDLGALPQDRVAVLTGFKPDHDHFSAAGYRTEAVSPSSAVICLPRAKGEALALIAEACLALPPASPILVDGQKTDGVDSILKLCRAAGLILGETLSKAHGKAFVLRSAPVPANWHSAPTEIAGGFITRPGVFSADAPDPGSVLLAAALPPRLFGRIADLGAGWGFLARAILARPDVRSLDLVEADRTALDCARTNVTDPRVAFHWADATRFKPAALWDAVVMNPPFHTARDADPGLGLAFLRAAHRNLLPTGALWLVANRHLPYDQALTSLFRTVEDIGGTAAFRLTRAANPVRAR